MVVILQQLIHPIEFLFCQVSRALSGHICDMNCVHIIRNSLIVIIHVEVFLLICSIRAGTAMGQVCFNLAYTLSVTI